MQEGDTVLGWTRGRRLHLVAPEGVLQPADLAAIAKVIRKIDDLDQVAEVVAELVGRSVRRRAWEPPTSDFYIEIEAPRG